VTLDRRLKLFVSFAGLFISSLLVGVLFGGTVHQMHAGRLVLPVSVGLIPSAIIFLLTDLINEFYGRRAARLITFVGFAMACFTVLFLDVVRELGGASPATVEGVFVESRWLLVSATVAFLVAQLVDIALFHLLRRWMLGRYLWLRATGSTVVSQLVDTAAIQVLLWYDKVPVHTILALIGASYVTRMVAAIGLTPVLYAGHALIERGLGLVPFHVEDR
jgi:queuosine precursor transporter